MHRILSPIRTLDPIRLLPVPVLALAAIAMLWPWPVVPLEVVGSPAMEADNHLWMLWAAVRGGTLGNWPEGDPRPVQDLVHVPVAAAGQLVDPALAYGLVALVDVVVALVGGWVLSREAGADRSGAIVGAIALGTAPFLGGALVFGLTEAWPIGWYALHGAMVLRTARTASWRAAVAGGLFLGAFALSGWYHAAFAAIGTPVWLAWARTWRPSDRGVALIALQWLVGGVMVAPALAIFLAQGDAAGLAARGVPEAAARWDWRHGSGFGADPLQLLVPGGRGPHLARTAYLGLVALGLAGIAVFRRNGPPGRERTDAAYAWLGLGLFGVLALGPHPQLAGVPIGPASSLPAGWLTAAVPFLSGISGWYRAVGVAMVFLAPAAALGASGIARGRADRGLVLALLVGIDAIALSDATWPRPTYDPRPPAAIAAIPGDGPLVLLPFDNGDKRWPEGAPRAYQRWQPWLDRPLAEAYEAPDALLVRSAWLAWVDVECAGGKAPKGVFAVPPPAERPSADAGALRALGVEAIAVVLPRSPTPNRCVRAVEDALGPPDGRDEVVAWWGLR